MVSMFSALCCFPPFFLLFLCDEKPLDGRTECLAHTKVSRCTMWRRARCLLISVDYLTHCLDSHPSLDVDVFLIIGP
ncbi:hypothetical protein B0H11DRAFT_2060040 [Mycena galericulata]|nr:hypothetical protein B0H11DRAFT_2060040 [Mycena galericulata]